MSHWNITQSYDIPPGNIIPAMGQPVFAFNYPLYMYVERLTRELQLPIWNLRLDSAGNRTRACQKRSEHSNHSATELVTQLVTLLIILLCSTIQKVLLSFLTFLFQYLLFYLSIFVYFFCLSLSYVEYFQKYDIFSLISFLPFDFLS